MLCIDRQYLSMALNWMCLGKCLHQTAQATRRVGSWHFDPFLFEGDAIVGMPLV